jgi:superfamily I DNA/RNA helicase
MMARLSFGLPAFPVRPTYVGPSQRTKGLGRFLVKGKTRAEDRVYELDPAKLESIQAEIPEADLIRQGITPGPRLDSAGNPIASREFSEDEIIDLSQAFSEPATEEDYRLAKATPTAEEQKLIDEEKAKSPLAKLAPGTEAKMSEQEVSDLLDGKTEVPAPSKEESKLDDYSQQMVDDLFAREEGKTPAQINRTIKALHNQMAKYGENDASKELLGRLNKLVEDKGGKPFDPKEAAENKNLGFDEVTDDFDKQDKQQRWEKNYEGGQILLEVAKGSDGKYGAIVYSGTDRETGSWAREDVLDVTDGKDIFKEADKLINDTLDADAKNEALIEKAIKDAMDGKLVSLDEVIDDAKPSGKRKGAPLDSGDDDISWDDEVAPTPTPASEPEESPVPGEEFIEPVVPATEKDVPLDIPENEQTGNPDSANNPAPEVPAEDITAEYLAEAFDTVGKMTDEELDKIAAGQDFTQDMGGFTPSVEQARALAAIAVANANTVMEALAGAGKTSVLVAAAKAIYRLRPNDGVLVLCFGAKNAADAKARVPRENSDAMTTHRLARRTALSKTQKSALKSKAAIISKDKDLAVHLAIDDTMGPDKQNIDAESGAMLVRKIVTEFCNSDSPALSDDHVLKGFSKFFGMPLEDFGSEAGQYKIDPKWLKFGEAFWADIQSDKKPGYYDKVKKKFVGDKRIKIDHDHYLKLWQLGNPDLSKLTVRGKPVRVVLMDEAQDTNPTVAAVLKANKGRLAADTVLKANKGRLQISYVGDTNQNIFSFRGSKNALRDAKVDADAVIPLTMTYRFGDTMTGPANGFLNLLGHNRRMIGTPDVGKIVEGDEELTYGPHRAHLTRSNYGGMKDIMKFMAQGKKVGALSVFYNEIRSNYYYIKWLERDFSDPERKKGPMFPDGSPIKDCDFSRITNMAEWSRAAKRDPKSIIARWKKAYDMGEFEAMGEVVDKIIVDRSDVGDVDSVLDGSAGASGKVWIAPDGKGLDYDVLDNGSLVFSGDATMSYVNGEQLYKKIKERGYAWNDEERGAPFTGWAKIFSSDDDRQKELDEVAALIPNRLNANEEVPDVIVSTAHRAKGLEWDDVSIGDDWPDLSDEDKEKEALNPEALRLAYVAASRARKNLSLGSLGWVRDFEGRDGLTLANQKLKRPSDFGVDAWDYRDERKAEMDKKNGPDEGGKPKKIGAALSSTDRKGRVKDEGEFTVLKQGPDGGSVPPNFLDGWVRVGAGDRKQYSKKIDGVRWEVTQNSDGSVLLRNRSDASVPSKKYDNMASLEADFKKVRNDGVKNNRENAKNAINTLNIDPTGKLAKMIDNGASGDDVFDEIMKTQAMLDAIENNDVSLSTLVAALDKLNNGRSLSANDSRKLRKPRAPKPRKAGKPTILPPGSSATLFDENPDRQDDGSAIGRAGITPGMRDQYIRAGGTESVPQMIEALLALNPDAKIRPDGSIVWYRASDYEEPENSKDFAGDKVDFELRIVPSQSGTLRVVAAYRKSDAPKTMIKSENGEFVADDENTKLLYHYSPHKSLDSILGVVDNPKAKTKSAGVERLLDMFFDRNFGKIPAPGKTQKQREQYMRYYGGIQGSIKRLRTGKLSSILNDKGADDTKFVLRTPEEDAIITLNGRNERHNLSTAKDAENFRRVMRKEVPSLLDAIDKKDNLAAFHSLLSYVSSIPDTNEAKEVARSVVKRSVQEKFPYLDQNELDHLLTRIDDVINREVLPEAGTEVLPHRYASGEVANVGDVVRWGNNQKEYSYGRVVQKIAAERDESGNYGYGNYVYVSHPGIDNPIKVSTFHLTKASQDQQLTSGRRTIKNAQRLVERSLASGDSVNFDTGEILDRNTGEPIPNIGFDPDFIDFNAIDFAKYGDRIIGGPTATKKTKASDLKVGDTLWDVNGGRIGAVYAVRTGTAKNGAKVVEVTFDDNPDDKLKTRQKFTADENVLASTPPGPKQLAPLTPLGETARDLNLGISPTTGTAGATLPIHKTDDLNEENTAPVKDSKLRAVRPTDEARDAKNKVVEIGSEIRSRVDDKIVNILRDRENLNVSSKADIDNIYDEVAKVSADASQKALDAKKALDDLHAADVKAFSTAASRKAIMAQIAADGYTLPNGLVDKDKLAKELAGRKLGSLSALVKRASDKNDALFAYAYKSLTDPASSARVKTMQKALESAKRISTDAKKKKDSMGAVVGKAARDAYKEVMAEEGVELDNVSMDEFDGHLYSLKRKLKLRSTDTFKSKQALQQFFDTTPSSVIRGLLSQLKSENKKLYIMSGVKRAYMTDEPDGYAVHLSNKRSYDDVTSATDAAVHEVTHVLEHIIPNIGPLQHAFLYDRAVMFPGTENETLPNFAYLPGQGMGRGERALAVPGLSLGYMSKQYPEDKAHILNPNDGHFEVSTVLMQELASSFGIASRGRGLNVVTADYEMDGSRKVISNVHFDPATGKYYTDDTMQTPIDNAIMAFGRDPKTGVDNDARDFIYGMVYSLSDRQQTPPGGGSASNGNPPGGSGDVAVPKPTAAVEAILKKESAKPDAGFLATILSKFGGGTNLTRAEYAELLDYLSQQFGSGSGYGASQARAVKNYLAKILGL